MTAFIVTMLVMVVFHEFGHYITARKFGIKVEEFFVGFGPRIFSYQRGETEYGLKAILLGGYVKIAGMNPFQEITEAERPRTFGAKPAWQRAIVLSAGSFTHFILATVLFAVMYGVVGLPDPDRPLTTINIVAEQVEGQPGPAAQAGMQEGDRIVEIEGVRITDWDQVRELIRPAAGERIEVVVARSGEELSLEMVPVAAEMPISVDNPEETETAGQIGIGPEFFITKMGPGGAVIEGVKTTGEAIWLSITGVGRIFHPGISEVFKAMGGTGEREVTADQPVGLVGGARIASQAGEAGSLQLLSFLGIFIVFIGVINLAPLPPLDGGHLVLLALEKVMRREIDARKVIPVAAAVLAFFVLLGGALVYLDVARPMQNPFQ